MPPGVDPLIVLQDPIVLVAAAVVLLALWRFSGLRKRRLRKHRATLRARAGRAESLRERHALMQQWNELGGLRERERAGRQRSAREDGQKARAAGRPISANPYRHGLWGEGRQWKRGWRSVDRHIRWIHRHRD